LGRGRCKWRRCDGRGHCTHCILSRPERDVLRVPPTFPPLGDGKSRVPSRRWRRHPPFTPPPKHSQSPPESSGSLPFQDLRTGTAARAKSFLFYLPSLPLSLHPSRLAACQPHLYASCQAHHSCSPLGEHGLAEPFGKAHRENLPKKGRRW